MNKSCAIKMWFFFFSHLACKHFYYILLNWNKNIPNVTYILWIHFVCAAGLNPNMNVNCMEVGGLSLKEPPQPQSRLSQWTHSNSMDNLSGNSSNMENNLNKHGTLENSTAKHAHIHSCSIQYSNKNTNETAFTMNTCHGVLWGYHRNSHVILKKCICSNYISARIWSVKKFSTTASVLLSLAFSFLIEHLFFSHILTASSFSGKNLAAQNAQGVTILPTCSDSLEAALAFDVHW